MALFEFSEWLVAFLGFGSFVFDWDEGNSFKNKLKHQVSTYECEEVFLDPRLAILGYQKVPVAVENRYAVVGKSKNRRILFIVFTLREERIRVISARGASRTEKEDYEQKERKT